jgi:hypothetical protein
MAEPRPLQAAASPQARPSAAALLPAPSPHQASSSHQVPSHPPPEPSPHQAPPLPSGSQLHPEAQILDHHDLPAHGQLPVPPHSPHSSTALPQEAQSTAAAAPPQAQARSPPDLPPLPPVHPHQLPPVPTLQPQVCQQEPLPPQPQPKPAPPRHSLPLARQQVPLPQPPPEPAESPCCSAPAFSHEAPQTPSSAVQSASAFQRNCRFPQHWQPWAAKGRAATAGSGET